MIFKDRGRDPSSSGLTNASGEERTPTNMPREKLRVDRVESAIPSANSENAWIN